MKCHHLQCLLVNYGCSEDDSQSSVSESRRNGNSNLCSYPSLNNYCSLLRDMIKIHNLREVLFDFIELTFFLQLEMQLEILYKLV